MAGGRGARAHPTYYTPGGETEAAVRAWVAGAYDGEEFRVIAEALAVFGISVLRAGTGRRLVSPATNLR